MSLATLFSTIRTPADLAEFTFSNNADHIDISAAILAQKKMMVINLVLEPLDPQAIQVWLLNHQAVHVQQTGILGVDGQDFTNLNLQDRESLLEWVFEHATEHRNMRAALGM
jgi:hypothetical protein